MTSSLTARFFDKGNRSSNVSNSSSLGRPWRNSFYSSNNGDSAAGAASDGLSNWLLIRMDTLADTQERMERSLASLHVAIDGLAHFLMESDGHGNGNGNGRTAAGNGGANGAAAHSSQSSEPSVQSRSRKSVLKVADADDEGSSQHAASKRKSVVMAADLEDKIEPDAESHDQSDDDEEVEPANESPDSPGKFAYMALAGKARDQNSPRAEGDVRPLALTDEDAGPEDVMPVKSAKSGSRTFDDMQDGGQLWPSNLPLDWPNTVPLRQSLAVTKIPWDTPNNGGRGGVYSKTGSSLKTQLLSKRTQNLDFRKTTSFAEVAWSKRANDNPFLARLMMDPASPKHVAYRLLNVLVLLHDLTVTPWMLAWDVPFSGALYTLALCSCIFWTCDIGVSFITGVQRGESVEMQPRKVAKNFLKTMFIPDVALAICNWLSFVVGASPGTGGTGSSLRVIRFSQVGKLFRIASLLRLMHVGRTLEDIMENRLSDTHRIILNCVFVVAGTLWINHLVCCAWFALGKMGPSDTGMRWTVSANARTPLYEYMTAMHWSVAQFTLGAIDVNASNSGERMFNIATLLVGLVFGSTLVSSLSATMVDYQMNRKTRNEELRKLRRYLRESHVSQTIAVCVVQQARERLGVQEKIQEKDVTALQKISKSLFTELRCEMFMPRLNTHPLFRLWATFDMSVVRLLCTFAIEYITALPTDDLFQAGACTDRAYLLCVGDVEYTKEPDTSPGVSSKTTIHVRRGSWMSEASLWSHWTHVGTAKAGNTCQVMVISAEGIMWALQRDPDLKEVTGEYCQQFHRRITNARPPQCDWPDDLYVPHTEYDELVMSMTLEMQSAIGIYAVEYAQARDRGGWSMMPLRQSREVPLEMEKLKEEIRNGKSIVILDANGQLERVVSVVCLRVHTPDDMVLVEMAKGLNDGAVRATCQIPGLKMDVQETNNPVGTALNSLLEIVGLGRKSDMIHREERIVECRMSKDYSVNTKYLRMMHSACIGEDDLDLVPLTASRQILHRKTGRFHTYHARATNYSHSSEQRRSNKCQIESMKAYKVTNGEKNWIFAWLSTTTFQYLASAAGEKELDEWVAVLNAAEEPETVGL